MARAQRVTTAQLISVLELTRDKYLWKGGKATYGRWGWSFPAGKERCVCYAVARAEEELGIETGVQIHNLIRKHLHGKTTMEIFLIHQHTLNDVYNTSMATIQTYRVAMINNMIAMLQKRSRKK